MINNPEVAATIAALHEEYEEALVSNDVAKLLKFFWDSPHALRFGVRESLYGSEEIEEFRRNRPAMDLARTVSKLKIVTFDDNCAIVTLEFDRMMNGSPRHGRQSQVWRKFDDDWKIVSAHVSVVPPSFVDQAAPLVTLPVPQEFSNGVQQNLDRAAAIAKPLLEMELSETVEAGPVFVP